jgi:hypothetical protein
MARWPRGEAEIERLLGLLSIWFLDCQPSRAAWADGVAVTLGESTHVGPWD